MSTSINAGAGPSRPQEPPRKESKDEEFQIPPIGTSPITGLVGSPIWGALNRPSLNSRWGIGDADSDDEENWLPMGGLKIQLPTVGVTIATLPSPMIWQTECYFAGGVFIFSLCQNGHLYQTTPSGVTTDVYAAGQTMQVGGAILGSAIITGLVTATLSVGMGVSGTGVPPGTTIASIDSSSQIHLSALFTGASGSVTLSFSTPLFTTSGVVDIAIWQATKILISDSAAQNVYSWDGSTLLIALNTQPVQFITVSSGRLWMANGSVVQWTNANTYNSLAGDSGSYIITDTSCSNPVDCLLDTPAGVFMSGSNWIKQITNLQDIGTPAVLTFQQNTIEGQIGPLTKWGVILVGNVVFFTNNAGIWAINGSQPAQISAPALNGFFANLDFTKSKLSAAYGMVNAVPCVFFQAYYKGDSQVAAGYTVFGYTLQGEQWFRYSQGTIAWISGTVSTAIANNNPVVWGCDGTNIFTLFTGTGNQISQWNSKLWTLGSPLDLDNILTIAIELVVTAPTTVTLNQIDETNQVAQGNPALSNSQSITPGVIQYVNRRGHKIFYLNNSATRIQYVGTSSSVYFLPQFDGAGRLRRLGLNVTVSSIGASLIGVVVSMHRTETGRGT